MIALVTDSNSQLTVELRDRYAVDVVPMTVVVDGQAHLEGDGIDLRGIVAALRAGAVVGSSTPSPGQFLQAYERAAARGATEILSVHAGGSVSGTANAAQLAARLAPLPVEVVDTASASFPVALCVWAAGEALSSGASLEAAAEAARRTAGSVGNVFVVGTLALAARGGRLAADVSHDDIPVLALERGAMQAVGRVSDMAQATEAMASYVVDQSAGARLRIGVGQLLAEDLAEALEEALRDRCEVEQLVRYDIGPSVAVHTGLGTVGTVFHAV